MPPPSLQIGSLHIDHPVFLAPMAGVTDHPFRVLCRRFGVGVVYTEFVSANGIIRGGAKTLRMVRFTPNERPIGIQVFGDTPEVIAASVAYLAKKHQPDLIDLNFGCPVPKIVKKGAGSAMLRDLALMREVVTATVAAAGQVPVTVKMRSGWDSGSLVAVEAAAIIEECGAKALTLHPRTTSQGFTGRADWSLIKAVKEQVGIPVIGNGDIHTADDALRMFDETGCDAVMVARGVLGSPWIFRQIGELLAGGAAIQVNPVLIADTCREHFELLRRYYSERMTVNLSTKHLNWYLKGFPGAAQWRRRFMACDTSAQLDQLVTDFHNFAHSNGEAMVTAREPDQVINVT